MINLYLDSIRDKYSILYDKDMLTEEVYVYRENQGQYFCAIYYSSDRAYKTFSTEGDGDYKLGDIIKKFSESWQSEFLKRIVHENKKKKYFRGSDQVRFFFKYSGKSLSLIDVWTEKEGYIRAEDYNKFFCIPGIECSELIYTGVLSNNFIQKNPDTIVRRANGTKIKI